MRTRAPILDARLRLAWALAWLTGSSLVPAVPGVAADDLIRCVALREAIVQRDQARCVFATRVESTPRLDGVLDDEAWKGAAVHTGFVEHQATGTWPINPGQTEVRVVYSPEALVLAVRCVAARPGSIRHELDPSGHDGDVFSDDCIEVVMVVAYSTMRFNVAASGARADSLNGEPGWNPAWSSAVAVTDEDWTAEIAIPFASLDGRRPPRPNDPGSSMRFNVCRSAAPIRLVSSLFPGYDDPSRMGWLVVGTPAAWKARIATRPGIRFDDIALLLDKWAYDAVDGEARGRVRLVGAAPTSDGPDSIAVRLVLIEPGRADPVAVFRSDPLTDAVLDFAIDLANLPVGKYSLRAEVLGANDAVLKSMEHPLARKADAPITSQGAIPVVVDFPAATAEAIGPGGPIPVYAGVPLPRTVAAQAGDFRLYDRQGRELPSQAEPITRWSPRGSIQWLGVRFLADSADISPCELRYGGAPPDPGPAAPRLDVTDTDERIVVNTGALRFEVLRQRFDGLHRAWFDANADGVLADEEQVIDEEPVGPFVVDESGKAYFARYDDHAEVVVESSGPICVVIRCAGWYVADDGARICRHVSRLIAHAGVPWVKVLHTVVFCADSRETAIADIAWPTRLRRPAPEARFGGDSQPIPVVLAADEGASLLQHEPDAFMLRRFASGPQAAPEVVASGRRADGWAEATADGVAVAVGLRDFAATYPRELEVRAGEIVLHLWPANGVDKPIKLPTEDDLSELWFLHHRRLLDFRVPDWFSGFRAPGPFADASAAELRHGGVASSATTNGMGVARSCEFFLNFRPPQEDNLGTVCSLTNLPPLASAAPAWMCGSQAFGPLAPVDLERFPLIEQALDARHDGERSIERFSVGLFNHGGSTSYFLPEKRSYDQLDRPWRLTHHGAPRVPWLLFARSGDRKFADYGLRHGAWCADLAFCHYSTPALEREGFDGKIRGAMCDYKAIVPWSRGGRILDYNSMADFLVWMTAMSGDRRPLEVAEEWGQCAKQRFGVGVGRNAAGTLDTLLTLYELTWDMDYRELAERQFLAIADRQLLPSGHFRLGIWFDYAPWLAHYHRFTGSDRALDVAVRWSDRVIQDAWLGDGEFGGDTKFSPAMGYPLYDVFGLAFAATGDRKYLDVAFGCSLLPALSTVRDRQDAFYGFDTYSSASFGGYYTQTVPYILPVLAEHGSRRAVFPPWTLRGRKVLAYVQTDAEQGDVELFVHVVTTAGQQETDLDPLHVKLMDDRGQSIGPMPVEMVRSLIREQPDETLPPGENDHGRTNYARIAIPPQMLGGTIAILLAYPRGGRDVAIRLPMQIAGSARLAYRWTSDLRFDRGSAIYFQPKAGAREMVLEATSMNLRPHMLALLDGTDELRAVRTWHHGQGSATASIRTPLRGGDDRQVWCCLQGLTKSLHIKPSTDGVPPFFSDSPERFFVPEVTSAPAAVRH